MLNTSAITNVLLASPDDDVPRRKSTISPVAAAGPKTSATPSGLSSAACPGGCCRPQRQTVVDVERNPPRVSGTLHRRIASSFEVVTGCLVLTLVVWTQPDEPRVRVRAVDDEDLDPVGAVAECRLRH